MNSQRRCEYFNPLSSVKAEPSIGGEVFRFVPLFSITRALCAPALFKS